MATPPTISGIINKYPEPKSTISMPYFFNTHRSPIKCKECGQKKLPNEFDKENLISKNIICKECVKKQFGEEDEIIDEIIRKRNEERNKSRELNLTNLNKTSFIKVQTDKKEHNYPESVFPMDLGGKKKTQKRRRNYRKTNKKNKKNKKNRRKTRR